MATGCFFVGISGGSGSGKTFLARALANALGEDRTALVDTDAYYRDLSGLDPGDRARVNFDHPHALEADLLAAHLTGLSQGQTVEKPVYDFSTHTRSPRTLTVRPRPFVLVEGVMVLALAPVAACLDFSIFLDLPADLRFIRRLRRDQQERGRSADQIIAQYLDQVRPMHQAFVAPCRARADLVVDETPDISHITRTLEAARNTAFPDSLPL